MRYLLIALTLTGASAAVAQTSGTVVLVTPNNETSLRLPKEPCTLPRTINWAYNGTSSTLCTDLRFWLVSGTSCGEEPPATGARELTRVSQSELLAGRRSGQVSFTVGELPGFTGEVTCPAQDKEDAYRLCASVKVPGGLLGNECGSTGSVQKDEINIVYDAKPPAAPTIESVLGLDKALSIRVSAGDDTSEVIVTVKREDGTGTQTERQSAEQPLFRVENLENNVAYSVTATAVDEAGNESAASEATTGTPIFTRGFYDRYVEAGGQEMGGCGAAGGGLAAGWVLAVLGFWLSSRRNRS